MSDPISLAPPLIERIASEATVLVCVLLLGLGVAFLAIKALWKQINEQNALIAKMLQDSTTAINNNTTQTSLLREDLRRRGDV